MAGQVDPLSSNISALTSILNLFTDKKTKVTTGGGSQVEETQFSKEGIESILRSLMEGTAPSSGGRGLAEITSGQKAPGLYNATTRNLLTNDFVARVTGNVAERSARRVITKDPTTQTTSVDAPIDPKTGLLAGAGLLLASKKSRKGLMDSLEDLLANFSIPLGADAAVSNSAGAGNAARGMGAAPLSFNLEFAQAANFAPDVGMNMAEPYIPPVAATPEPAPEPVVTPPPAVEEPPAPVIPPAIEPTPTPAPEPAPAPVAPPPVPVFDRASYAALWGKGKYSQANALLNAYRTQLNTYNQTYGSTYVVDAYGIVSGSAATAPYPITSPSTGGGGSTPTYTNPTTDNLFQGNLGGVGSGSGDSLVVGF